MITLVACAAYSAIVCLMSWLVSAEKKEKGHPGEGQVDIYVHLAGDKVMVAVSDGWFRYTVKKVNGFKTDNLFLQCSFQSSL